jgi:hypothetical protein
MGLIMEFGGSIEGYETVPLFLPGHVEGRSGGSAVVLRRRSARPSRRAVVYVQALDDEFVTPAQASWYTGRAFHFYVADLRGVSTGRGAGDQRGWSALAAGHGGSLGDTTLPAPAAGGSGPGTDPSMWDTATFDAVTLEAAAWERTGMSSQAQAQLRELVELLGPAANRGHRGNGGAHRGAPGQHRRDGSGPNGARADESAPDPAGRSRAAGDPVRPGPVGSAPSRPEPSRPGPARPGPGAGRALPPEVSRAAEELGECFAGLDAAVDHVREIDEIDTVVMAAHSAGALVAALWAHARGGRHPVDALVLANPSFGGRPSWLARMRALREDMAGWRSAPLLVGARRRLRRGLEIGCPVLVMAPTGNGEPAPAGGGGWLPGKLRGHSRSPVRLGAHVTWLTMETGLPGGTGGDGAEGREFYEELTRWLGAYLSGQIRDQLL